jgi:hypothetical protein
MWLRLNRGERMIDWWGGQIEYRDRVTAVSAFDVAKWPGRVRKRTVGSENSRWLLPKIIERRGRSNRESHTH